ncbi:MAG: phage integrase N-terminal SAM-like domain-containing protein [Endozoicomonas sp.]
MPASAIEAFLEHLAVNRRVSPSTQNQALCAHVFMYRELLARPPEQLTIHWSKKPRRLPVVLAPRRSCPYSVTCAVPPAWLLPCCTAVACASMRPCLCVCSTWISAAR